MTSEIINCLIQLADETPDKIVLISEHREITYKELMTSVYELADWLKQYKRNCIGVCLENSIEWVVVDLACIIANVTHVVLPNHYSDKQLKNIINIATPDVIFSDDIERLTQLGLKYISCNKLMGLNVLSLMHNKNYHSFCSSCSKVSFLFDGVNDIKSFCVHQPSIDLAVTNLCRYMQGMSIRNQLCLLSLERLLENITEIYVPLLMGITIHVVPVKNLGLNGHTCVDSDKLIKSLKMIRPDSLLLTPELLSVLVDYTNKNNYLPFEPKFIAVYGKNISYSMVEKARYQGWPVYTGYMLYENGMPMSINVPGMERMGSVGKPFPHLKVGISKNEICFSNEQAFNCLDHMEKNRKYIHTGDSGYLDNDGYLYLSKS